MRTGLCNVMQLSLFRPCFVALFRLLSMAFRLQLGFGATLRCSKRFEDLLIVKKEGYKLHAKQNTNPDVLGTSGYTLL